MTFSKITKISCLLAMATLPVFTGCNKADGAKAKLAAAKPSTQTLVKEDVATTTAEQITMPKTVWLTGSLAADEQSDVASKQGGIVNDVLIDIGTVVKKGDVMVQMDTVDAVNALEQTEARATELLVRLGLTSTDEKFDPAKQPDVKAAKATLDLAASNFERDQALIKSKVISPGEFDETRNAYNKARQAYDLAVAQANQLYRQFQTALTSIKSAQQVLKDMAVKAPFDGVVVQKTVAPGQSFAATGARGVARLVRINPLRLVLSVPELEVGKIQKGQTVNFTVDAYPGERFHGTVKRISPALDPETRTLTVEAEVPNEQRILKPGLFASAQLELEAERPAVRVPASAVRRRDDVAQVFVVDEGIARAAMVVAGETKRGFVEIVEGLEGGETIVSNAAQVEDGIRIQ